MLKHLREYYPCAFHMGSVYHACQNKNFDMFVYLLEDEEILKEFVLYLESLDINLNGPYILKIIMSKNLRVFIDHTAYKIKYVNLKIFQYAYGSGNLDMIKYLHKIDKLIVDTYYLENHKNSTHTKNININSIDSKREDTKNINIKSIDTRSENMYHLYTNVIKNGHYHVLEWLTQSGIKFSKSMLNEIIAKNNIELFDYFIDGKYELDIDNLFTSVRHDNLKIFSKLEPFFIEPEIIQQIIGSIFVNDSVKIFEYMYPIYSKCNYFDTMLKNTLLSDSNVHKWLIVNKGYHEKINKPDFTDAIGIIGNMIFGGMPGNALL
jgi:hypothetical protein